MTLALSAYYIIGLLYASYSADKLAHKTEERFNEIDREIGSHGSPALRKGVTIAAILTVALIWPIAAITDQLKGT